MKFLEIQREDPVGDCLDRLNIFFDSFWNTDIRCTALQPASNLNSSFEPGSLRHLLLTLDVTAHFAVPKTCPWSIWSRRPTSFSFCDAHVHFCVPKRVPKRVPDRHTVHRPNTMEPLTGQLVVSHLRCAGDGLDGQVLPASSADGCRTRSGQSGRCVGARQVHGGCALLEDTGVDIPATLFGVNLLPL